ncbi:MAG: outer membrane beta-barrel protein [Bacteroidetes bacterium]|jgi:outer membrane protein OmpA-like peptidoglycan-associated protein|nr:outer membrane beta-barrel protein [Bacteroidota bacterium]
MKNSIFKANVKKESRKAWFPYNLIVKSFIACTFLMAATFSTLQAQEAQEVTYTQPTWRFGVAAGANFNFHEGTTQQLTNDFMVGTAFGDAKGVGLFAAPVIEYHRPGTVLGFMLQAGYDSRKGTWDQVRTPCNCPADLETGLSYITIEPSLRIAPFKSNFFIFLGPRLAFNLDKDFLYQEGISPDYPNVPARPDVEGEFSEVKKSIISMQIGAGYDIPLSADTKQTKVLLSPFVSFHPYFGQEPRSIESWNITTIRAGLALKIGRGHEIAVREEIFVPMVIVEPDVTFIVESPENIPVERSVRETFPVRNYVFFNQGSTQIPSRYVLLEKDQVEDFSEDQLEVYTPKTLTGRSKRQMTVYYNVLNILGDRMLEYPNTSVSLTGSSRTGVEDGKAMAEATKKYLTDVFEIAPSRIRTDGQLKPTTPSEQPGGKLELVLLREEDRRVTIASGSAELLMEFHSGNDIPLRPVEITDIQEAPIDSYVTFQVAGADTAFTSWTMELEDKKGMVQTFGPYSRETVSIPGKTILGTNPDGNYTIRMTGQTESGKLISKETTANLVLWTPPEEEEMMRFSIIYEFNTADAIAMYDKYLTEIVTPKIPENGTVIIHGHTDIIGGEDFNLNLSTARANDVKKIMQKALAKANRNDVTFEVYGFGEDENLAPFENRFPEERFYNRTVIIDIIPAK